MDEVIERDFKRLQKKIRMAFSGRGEDVFSVKNFHPDAIKKSIEENPFRHKIRIEVDEDQDMLIHEKGSENSFISNKS